MKSGMNNKNFSHHSDTEEYCTPINIGGYLIWRILPSGHIDYYLKFTEFGVLYKPY